MTDEQKRKHPLEVAIEECRRLASRAVDREVKSVELCRLSVMLMKCRTVYSQPEEAVPASSQVAPEIIGLGFTPKRVENHAVGIVHFHGTDDGQTLVIFPAAPPVAVPAPTETAAHGKPEIK